jgi:hypothetical protein
VCPLTTHLPGKYPCRTPPLTVAVWLAASYVEVAEQRLRHIRLICRQCLNSQHPSFAATVEVIWMGSTVDSHRSATRGIGRRRDTGERKQRGAGGSSRHACRTT